MKNFLLLFFVIALSPLFGQDDFKFDFDYARFNVDDTSNYLELYYSFFKPGISSFEKDGAIYKSGELYLNITGSETGEVFVDKDWNFNLPADTAYSRQDQNLCGVLKFFLPNGKYNGTIIGSDANNLSGYDSTVFSFEMMNPPSDKFAISDIEAASAIKQYFDDTESIFYKNTLEVIPNPSLIYGDGNPVLFLYCEFYNLDKVDPNTNIRIDHLLYNSRNELKYTKSKFVPAKNNSIVEIGVIRVNKLPTGIYDLIVAASDTVQKISFASSKKIYIYNKDIIDTALAATKDVDLLSTELAVMTEEELDLLYAKSKYIASNPERERWDALSELEGKRSFLYKFWKRRDSDINTPENETKIGYFKRVDYAHKQYGNLSRKEGWKTDQGRVFIVYGPPNEVERHPYEENTKPYEIWYYNDIEGGVIFLFADLTGYSNYRLMHSTKRGELADQQTYNSIVRSRQ